jgi:hypothetical protein
MPAAALVLACTSVLGSDYPTTVLSHSPLGYWRLDEAGPSPALHSVANSGSAGSAANGYVVNTVSLTVTNGMPGIVGNCARFSNPSAAIGSGLTRIDVPWSTAINPNPPFSVEMWANFVTIGSDSTGTCPLSNFSYYDYGGGSRWGWLFYVRGPDGRWQFRLGTSSGYAAICSATSGNAVAGTWQHIVATFDGTTVLLYVNGAQVGSSASAPWTPNPQQALRMGNNELGGSTSDGPWIDGLGNTGNRGFDGFLDEVAVYPTLLSAGQVKAHFDAATTNNAGYHAQIIADGPSGYWELEEPAVTPPNPSTFPIAANSGSLGSAADATNMWGTLAGQPDSGFAGLLGGKSTFSDGLNGYISVKDAPGLHFSGNVTMMAWVKLGSKDYFRNIIERGWDASYAETFLRVSMSDDGSGAGTPNNYYELGASDGAAGTYYDAALYQIPPGDVGNWVHLAGTFDGTGWNLYRNGVLVATVAPTTGDTGVFNAYTNSIGWTIGGRFGPPSPTRFFGGAGSLTDVFYGQGLNFSGNIDEPAIFNTALSASDIQAIYNSAQVKPQITRAPVVPPQTAANPGTLYSGSSASFDVWAEGGPTLGWLWLSNGVSTAITATNITLTNLRPGTPQISVVVTNASGTITSTVTPTVLATKPLVLQQPVATTRYTGRPFSFSVVAGGSQPFSYQWKTNGTDIPGATSATYSSTASAAVALNYSCLTSNEFGTSNTVAVALTVLPIPSASSYAPAVIGDGPVAYWRLGESVGQTVAHDYYNGHDGTYLATALGQPGYVPATIDPDTAAAFNGADSHVANINGNGATGGINFVGHTNFTLEAWVNGQPGQADEATIIVKGIGSSGTTATEQFALDVSGGAYRFFGRLGLAAGYSAVGQSGPDGTWQHVVGVYDDLNVLGGGKTMYIFVNGVQEGSGATRGGSGVRNSTDPLSIGSKRLGNDPSYNGTFNGTVDEVAIYPYALSSAQIVNHYTDAYGTALQPTIAIPPASRTNYVTTVADFEVVAYGTQPLTYQWYKGPSPLTDNGIVIGSTTRHLTINPVASTDADNYTVVVNNTVGPPATSSPAAVLTVLPLPTAPVDVSQLVMHLKFDGTLTDATGRGNNGTGMHVATNLFLAGSGVTNAATPSAGNQDFKYVPVNTGDGPPVGQALHYASYTSNGYYASVQGGMATVAGNFSTNSYYVSLGSPSDLRFSSNVNFSISYWVRFPPYNGSGDLGDLPFFCSAVTATFASGIVLAPNYNSGGTGVGQKGGGWAYSLEGSVAGFGLYGPNFSLDDGNWHHLVHSFDRAGLGITYLDGQKVDSRSVAGLGSLDTADFAGGNNAFCIGQDPTGSYPESGAYDIDDIGVWRKALSQLEVNGIYLAATNAGASFTGTYTPPNITVTNLGGNKLQLTWPSGRLQSATSAAGPYSDIFQTNPVSGATVPATSPYTNTISGARKFFRARD